MYDVLVYLFEHCQQTELASDQAIKALSCVEVAPGA